MEDNKKINIAFVITNLSKIGPGIVLRSIVRGLNKKKFNIFVFSITRIPRRFKHSSIKKDLTLWGAEVIEIDLSKPFDLFCVFHLWHYFKKYKIQIAHTHLIRAHIYGRISAKLAGVPIILSTVHNMDRWKISPHPLHKFVSFTDRSTSHLADKIVTVSDAVGDYIWQYQGISRNKMVTIYNGIDLENYNLQMDSADKKRELRLNLDEDVVGFVGRLDEQKGCEYFIKAASKILENRQDVQFLIVGEGTLRKSLERLAANLKVGHKIIFSGYRNDVPEVLACMDIFVLPSLWEGFGLSLVEAMAMGKAVVTTNVGPLPELVDQQKTGIIVPSGEYRSLVKAILFLLEDRNAKRMMGSNARNIVLERFSSEKMACEYNNLYYELLDTKYRKMSKQKFD